FGYGFFGALGGEVDSTGFVKAERDAGFLRIDQAGNCLDDVTTRHVVGFEFVDGDGHPGFNGHDAGIDDEGGRELAQVAHGDEVPHADGGAGGVGLEPHADEGTHEKNHHEDEDDEDDGADFRQGDGEYGLDHCFLTI